VIILVYVRLNRYNYLAKLSTELLGNYYVGLGNFKYINIPIDSDVDIAYIYMELKNIEVLDHAS
jgi:hypothetical protein